MNYAFTIVEVGQLTDAHFRMTDYSATLQNSRRKVGISLVKPDYGSSVCIQVYFIARNPNVTEAVRLYAKIDKAIAESVDYVRRDVLPPTDSNHGKL